MHLNRRKVIDNMIVTNVCMFSANRTKFLSKLKECANNGWMIEGEGFPKY